MKWLDHRSRPDYRAYNFTRNAVASINRGLFQAGGSAYTPPAMSLLLARELIHTDSGAYTGNGLGNWKTARGAERDWGLSNGTIITDIYSFAAELVENYPSSTVADWGVVDRTDVTAAAVSDGGAYNPFGYTQRLTGLTWWESATDPYGASLELTAGNFYARGHGIAQADGTGDWYVDIFGISPGPGWEEVGQAGVSRWLRYPYTYTVSPSYNVVGCVHPLDGDYHSSPVVMAEIAGAQIFGLPLFLRGRAPTVTAARIECNFGSLVRHKVTCTTTITDEETGARSTDFNDDTTVENIGITLLGGRRSGTRYEWDALATVEGSAGESDKWMIMDGANIVNAMLGGRGTYHAFALIPSPAVTVLENTDSAGWLKSMLPDYTMGYIEIGTGDTMDEIYNPIGDPDNISFGAEGTYIQQSVAEWVEWDSSTIGNIDITFDPLLGEDGQVVLPGVAFPRMD